VEMLLLEGCSANITMQYKQHQFSQNLFTGFRKLAICMGAHVIYTVFEN